MCFYIPFFIYGWSTTLSPSGRDASNVAELGSSNHDMTWLATDRCIGTTVAISSIFAANVYTGLVTQSWTKLATICIVFSALSGFIWTAIYSAFPFLLSGIFPTTLSTGSFWLSFLLIQVFCLSPRFLYDYVQKTYFPRDVDIIRERQGELHRPCRVLRN